MSEPIRIPTGTGAQRRRLTLDEATAGCLPDRFTPDEWRAMHEAARRPSGPLPTEAPAMTDLEDIHEAFHPPLRDPVAVPTAHSTPPDSVAAGLTERVLESVENAPPGPLDDIYNEFIRWNGWPENKWRVTTHWMDIDAMVAEIAALRRQVAMLEAYILPESVIKREARR